jgi:exosortase
MHTTEKHVSELFLDKHNAIKFFVLLALWAIAFIPVYPELFYSWLNRANNSHGALVPVISAFLIWKKRDKLLSTPLSSPNIGAIILIASMTIYVLAYIGALAVVSRLMIVFSLIGLVLFVLGKQFFSEIKFPLFLLLFMVPVPDSIYGVVALPLQLFATKVSTLLIQAVGIPAYREGNIVYFAQSQLEVAEACSGLRSMMAFLMLSVLFAYMMKNQRWVKGGILVLSAVPLAILVNIIRVTGTGVLADAYGDSVARGFLHEFSGLVVFVLGFILLFFEVLILNKER